MSDSASMAGCTLAAEIVVYVPAGACGGVRLAQKFRSVRLDSMYISEYLLTGTLFGLECFGADPLPWEFGPILKFHFGVHDNDVFLLCAHTYKPTRNLWISFVPTDDPSVQPPSILPDDLVALIEEIPEMKNSPKLGLCVNFMTEREQSMMVKFRDG